MFCSPTILLSSRSRCFFHIAADSSESLMRWRGGGREKYVETKQSENLAVVIKGAGAVVTLRIPITQLRGVHAQCLLGAPKDILKYNNEN